MQSSAPLVQWRVNSLGGDSLGHGGILSLPKMPQSIPVRCHNQGSYHCVPQNPQHYVSVYAFNALRHLLQPRGIPKPAKENSLGNYSLQASGIELRQHRVSRGLALGQWRVSFTIVYHCSASSIMTMLIDGKRAPVVVAYVPHEPIGMSNESHTGDCPLEPVPPSFPPNKTIL